MVSVIGIWKSGAAYVPIDPEYPTERINYMIEDSQSKVVIDEEFLSYIDFNQEAKNINLTTPDKCVYFEATKEYVDNIINISNPKRFEKIRKNNENLVQKYIPNVKIVNVDADHLTILKHTNSADLML